MTILLMIVIGSPAGTVIAKKSNDDGTSNPNHCFQAGKMMEEIVGSVRVNSIIVAHRMGMDS
jgi:hypothetical protein